MLGVAPVGVTDWMGFENGIGPWAETAAKAAGDPPELLTNTDGIQFEKVAALRPDVIVALYSDLKKSDYEKLSQIAPVVAPPEGHADFGIPWQETTRTVGQVVGEPDEAEKLIGDLEARIAKAKEEHPEFAGKSASMAMSYEGIWVYGPDDPRSRLLTDLGFVLSPEISKLFVKDYAGMISEEQVQLLASTRSPGSPPRTRRRSSSATACTTASTSTRRTATSSCSTPARTTRTTRSARRRS